LRPVQGETLGILRGGGGRDKTCEENQVIHDQRSEDSMKSSARDKAEGKLHMIKGKAKEVAGRITDNPRLEAEGTAEKVSGKVQEKVGEVKKIFGE
jgi:uncharacterized protein YjbJ (UPF0337 family)